MRMELSRRVWKMISGRWAWRLFLAPRDRHVGNSSPIVAYPVLERVNEEDHLYRFVEPKYWVLVVMIHLSIAADQDIEANCGGMVGRLVHWLYKPNQTVCRLFLSGLLSSNVDISTELVCLGLENKSTVHFLQEEKAKFLWHCGRQANSIESWQASRHEGQCKGSG